MSEKKSIKFNEMSWHCDESYYSYISRLWELGEWELLSELIPEDLLDYKKREKVVFYKAISFMQAGRIDEVKLLLNRVKGVDRASLLAALLASFQNTLGKARVLQGEHDSAVRHFIESMSMTHGSEIPFQLYKARVRQQFELLDLDVDHYFKIKSGVTTSLAITGSAEKHLNEDLSLGFWLKLYSWPSDWTQIVGKLSSDTENEFCLRIKNQGIAQFYYGQGDKSVVLHTWNPAEHIKINQWVHLAVVKKQGKYSRLYVNGIIRAERDITGLEPAKHVDVKVMLFNKNQSSKVLDASLQDFWLTDKALTSRDVCATLLAENSDLKQLGYSIQPSVSALHPPLDLLERVQTAKRRWAIANRIHSLDYHQLIDALKNEVLNIVVVGANDGKNNDPLYDYLVNTSRKNTVVLVEPQKQLIPYLEDNYCFHPNKHIVNAAVGPEGIMTLYSIRKEYWDQLNVPYAAERNWPTYRAPTGVTSSDKAHVASWLKMYLPDVDLKSAIETFTVNSLGLESVLENTGIKGNIDVLQIDTEGFDHTVIYNSNLFYTKPKIIFFEVAHLSEPDLIELANYLASQNYELYHAQENSIALRNTDCQNI